VGAVEIAREQGIATEYAQQILQRLRKGNLVASVRGPAGGYRLSRSAEEITLRDILVAAEGETLELICESHPISRLRCDESALCGLRPLWADLREHVNEFLMRHTLADLVDRVRPHSEVVELPRKQRVEKR
jgi:Rrf2 family iron-sulfur cluster assembly transcriptional regulator